MFFQINGSRLLVGVVMVLGGVLFATSARTADGGDLRNDGVDLVDLAHRSSAKVQEREGILKELQADVDARSQSVSDVDVRTLGAKNRHLEPVAGMSSVQGDGIKVTLGDAPASTSGLAHDVSADRLVVHQQDIEAVMNALWSAGAKGMSVMDQRIVSTSAIRCAGNTLRVQGRTYSPPYVITAVGDVDAMSRALDNSTELDLFRKDARRFGLMYTTDTPGTVTLPPFEGSVQLRWAVVTDNEGQPLRSPNS